MKFSLFSEKENLFHIFQQLPFSTVLIWTESLTTLTSHNFECYSDQKMLKMLYYFIVQITVELYEEVMSFYQRFWYVHLFKCVLHISEHFYLTNLTKTKWFITYLKKKNQIFSELLIGFEFGNYSQEKVSNYSTSFFYIF